MQTRPQHYGVVGGARRGRAQGTGGRSGAPTAEGAAGGQGRDGSVQADD